MIDSVIHSAVMAGIFRSISSLRTRLLVFDTSVVDLSDQANDTVELLLRVQLGGGTDIAGALAYAESQIVQPRRTILILVTDFYEGGNEQQLSDVVAKLSNDGVILLGLAALDRRAEPAYNRDLAAQLAKRGMTIGAMTPDRLAEWVAERAHQ
jgi:Mg-chelatase subunit ChlD